MQLKDIKPGMIVAWKLTPYVRKVQVVECDARAHLIKVRLSLVPPASGTLCSVPPRQILGEWEQYQAMQTAKFAEREEQIAKWEAEDAALDKRFDAIKEYLQKNFNINPGRRMDRNEITLSLDAAEQLIQWIQREMP